MRKQIRRRREELQKGMQQVFPEIKVSTNIGNGRLGEVGSTNSPIIVANSENDDSIANRQRSVVIETSPENHLTKRPTRHHRSNSLNRMQQLVQCAGGKVVNMPIDGAVADTGNPRFMSIETCV